jgi:hypothetical protein
MRQHPAGSGADELAAPAEPTYSVFGSTAWKAMSKCPCEPDASSSSGYDGISCTAGVVTAV